MYFFAGILNKLYLHMLSDRNNFNPPPVGGTVAAASAYKVLFRSQTRCKRFCCVY